MLYVERFDMEADLFIKKIPSHLKELIGREAQSHRRSVNQETIVLLEEALAHRAVSVRGRREEISAILDRYAKARKGDIRAIDAVIEYDESGLPK